MSEWISVKDRFPDHNQKVIFYVKDRESCFCGWFEETGSILRKEIKNAFYENLDCWWFEDEDITHWMPLPKPPEES